MESAAIYNRVCKASDLWITQFFLLPINITPVWFILNRQCKRIDIALVIDKRQATVDNTKTVCITHHVAFEHILCRLFHARSYCAPIFTSS